MTSETLSSVQADEMVIPESERSPSLREILFRQAQNVAAVKHALQNPSRTGFSIPVSFFQLSAPWLPETGPESAANRTQIQGLGFDGERAASDLQRIFDEDPHLVECCPTRAHLAVHLDTSFITPAANMLSQGTSDTPALPPHESELRLHELFLQFLRLTYEQGRFRKIALSHLFNFDAAVDTIDFGTVQVFRLADATISEAFGLPPYSKFFNPPNVGSFFLLAAEGGNCANFDAWLQDKTRQAAGFAQILQYCKNGVVYIDYMVPHFSPNWASQLIKNAGTFFIGNPRRVPYAGGQKLFRLDDTDIANVKRWLKASQRPEIVKKLSAKNAFREVLYRAGDYYEASHKQETPVERLIALAIAVESLLTPQSSHSELTFRISQTAAQLAGATAQDRLPIFRQVREMYSRRSALFHGAYRSEDYYAGRFVTNDEVDEWTSIVRQVFVRFLTLYLRGENNPEAVRTALFESALDFEKADDLRRRSDPDSFLAALDAVS